MLLTPLNTDFAGRQFADYGYPAPGCGTVRFFWSSTQAEVDWRLASLGTPGPGEWIFGDYEHAPYDMDTWPHFTAVVEFWREFAAKARAAGWTKVGMCSLYPMTRLWRNIGSLSDAECNAYFAERLWPVLDGATTECYGEPNLGSGSYRGCLQAITDAGLTAFALLHPYSWKTHQVASPASWQRALDNALVDAPGGTILWQDAGAIDRMPPTGFSERRVFDLAAVRAYGLDEKQPWFEDIHMASDFDPVKTQVQVDQWSGHLARATVYPTVGGVCAVAYIDAAPGADLGAINTKLTEIAALSGVTLGKKVWENVTGTTPKMEIRVIARTETEEG